MGTEEGGKKIVIKRKLFSENRTIPGLPSLVIPSQLKSFGICGMLLS
jgi:hypothetical protein